jgi:hypothetical protein
MAASSLDLHPDTSTRTTTTTTANNNNTTTTSTSEAPQLPSFPRVATLSNPPTPTVVGSEVSYDDKDDKDDKGLGEISRRGSDSGSDLVMPVASDSAPEKSDDTTVAVSATPAASERGVHDQEMTLSPAAQQGLNIALPIIQEELGILESNLQWISSAYALTNGCFLLLAGRLADAYGRKKCFIVGLGWYAIWCLVGSFMHSGAALIVTRALAGIGAAMG